MTMSGVVGGYHPNVVIASAAKQPSVRLLYPKPGKGRSPVGLERMLRIYFLQQRWGGQPHGIGCADIGSIHDPNGA